MSLPNSAEPTPVRRLMLCVNTAVYDRLYNLRGTVSMRETVKQQSVAKGVVIDVWFRELSFVPQSNLRI